VLHHCIEGERVGVDGGEVVGVDRRHDGCPGGVPEPLGERGREPPSFFFLLGLPPRWEESFPSSLWPPWLLEGRSPSEIGSLSVSRSCFLAENRFLYSRRSVTSIGLKF
jgi:hypothetical protein